MCLTFYASSRVQFASCSSCSTTASPCTKEAGGGGMSESKNEHGHSPAFRFENVMWRLLLSWMNSILILRLPAFLSAGFAPSSSSSSPPLSTASWSLMKPSPTCAAAPSGTCALFASWASMAAGLSAGEFLLWRVRLRVLGVVAPVSLLMC